MYAADSGQGASASSRVGSGVGHFGSFWDTSRHKEVSHEQEVCGPAVRGRAWRLSGDHQESQGIVAEVSPRSNSAQGGCGWARVVGCQDCRGFQLPRADDREYPQTSGHRRLCAGSGRQETPGASHALQARWRGRGEADRHAVGQAAGRLRTLDPATARRRTGGPGSGRFDQSRDGPQDAKKMA